MDRSELELFVRLKYNLTMDNNFSMTYEVPEEVRYRWAWRCFRDVEHLHENHPLVLKCIEAAKLYDGSLIRTEDLHKSYQLFNDKKYNRPYSIGYSAAFAVFSRGRSNDARYCAEFAADNNQLKLDLYKYWLLEELYFYDQEKLNNQA